MNLLTQILSWLLPPIAGGVIGYVTNSLAIKMLFHPFTEKRLFHGCLHVPFTPGLLPRHRHDLAQKIGALVEEKLLTSDVIRARLHERDIEEALRKSFSEIITELMGGGGGFASLTGRLAAAFYTPEFHTRLIAIIDRKTPDALSAFNVRALVIDRIDSLKMSDVVKLVLDVMASHFKWINIAGGILGFLIGAFQAVLSHIF